MNIKHTQIALAVCALLMGALLLTPGISSAHDSDHHHSGADPAVVNDTQSGSSNAVITYKHDNSVGISGTSGNGVNGNIGVNEAAGDNNMQDNSTSIADTQFVFGGAQSTIETTQSSRDNKVISLRSDNSAGMNGGFANAGGNIGINEAAGSGNMQKNNLAVSTTASDDVLSESTVDATQRSNGNCVLRTNSTNTAYLAGNALSGASGNVGVNIASGSGNLQSNSLSMATSVASP